MPVGTGAGRPAGVRRRGRVQGAPRNRELAAAAARAGGVPRQHRGVRPQAHARDRAVDDRRRPEEGDARADDVADAQAAAPAQVQLHGAARRHPPRADHPGHGQAPPRHLCGPARLRNLGPHGHRGTEGGPQGAGGQERPARGEEEEGVRGLSVAYANRERVPTKKNAAGWSGRARCGTLRVSNLASWTRVNQV